MLSVIQMIVAVEMLMLPMWAAAMVVRPPIRAVRPAGLGVRAARALGGVVVPALLLLPLAAFADRPVIGPVLKAQGLAIGFVVLLVGVGAVLDRLAGGRAAQILTTLVGWAILGAVILAGPLAEMLQGDAQAALVRTVVHSNPLLVAERELGLDWLHQGWTYRLTPLAESFGYLLGDVACWKTMLAHLFIGSGLLVFSIGRSQRHAPAPSTSLRAGKRGG